MGNPLCVVVGVVYNAVALVNDTSSIQENGSNDNVNGGLSTTDCAMSGRDDPTVADDDSTAEVEVASGAERRLVRELTKRGDLTSDNSSAQEDIRNGCATKTLRMLAIETFEEILRDAETAATRATRTKAKRNILTEITADEVLLL